MRDVSQNPGVVNYNLTTIIFYILDGLEVGWPSVRTRVGRQIEISQSVYGDLKRVFRYFDYYALHTPKRPLEPCRRRLFVLPDRIPTEYYLTREWL